MSKSATKEKKSFSKKLFRRGSVRSVGSFMSRVLRTLSTLSHFGTEEHAAEHEKDDGGFTLFKTGAKGSVPSAESDCFLAGDKIPGVSGLKNHGNTCYMNAILQCLSNTELFAEYLALEHYRGEDAEEDKSRSSSVFSYRKGVHERGEVTEQLSSLVRALWTFEYTPQHSREFKNAVSKNALQYRGNAQHDAQEFLLWLLDRVHEDLHSHPSSRPCMKPPIEDCGASEGPPFPLTAGSFVQELFQAQYKSSLTCPHCQKQSNTFDPFRCISLPIPLPHTRPLYITVVYQGKCSHCMRVGVAVPLSSTVSRLREAVSLETKIPPDQIVLTEMYYDGFHRSFCNDDDDLSIIQESDSIFAFETPETFRLESIRAQRGSLLVNLNQNNLKYGAENARTSSFMQGAMLPANKNTGSEKMILLVCNRACSGHQGRRFGNPFVLYLERTVTWDVLQKEILEKMRHLLRPGVFVQVGPFSLRVVGLVGITYLLPQEEQPLCHPTVERAYRSCGQGGPPHVKIVVEWDKETKDYLFGHTEEEYIPDAESVRIHREQHHHPQACTLAQCFQLYTKEEQLALDDAWRCPHCRQLQQGRIKLSLWTLPDILILHLKRFRQEMDRRVKMQNMVRFPLLGLDMAPHVVKRSQSSWSLPSHWSPWRRPYGLGRDPQDYLYDLYAVCNHHGTMHGGHYTAFCKNSVDGQWYCFDDSDVQPIADEEVCKPTAYILFYQRRTTIPSWSANSSVAGSTSSSLCEHWVNRLPGSRQPSVASGSSSRRTSLASLAESVEFPGELSGDDGFSTRPFVRSVQRPSSSRSSMASPLALCENGIKPSWSLSAKLHLRSSSPSRFSLDSFSSSGLERIGEASSSAAADDKVSTSCFGRSSSGRAPLAMTESVTSDDGSSRKSLDEPYRRAPPPAERRAAKAELLDNNNRAPPGDSGAPSGKQKAGAGTGDSGAPSGKQKAGAGTGSTQKPEGVSAKRSSSKTQADSEKSSKKKQASSSTQSPPTPQASSTQTSNPQVSNVKTSNTKVSNTKMSSDKASNPKVSNTKVSNAKSKGDSKTSKASSSSSGTPSKKEAPPSQEGAPAAVGTPRKQRVPSGAQSSASPSPAGRRAPGAERSSAGGRRKPGERGSPLTDRPRSGRSGEGGRPERRLVRSSSSSSSVTSLRSPAGPSSSSSRDLRRGSRSEDKGLSFLKSALRQKETRRSADLGKSALLAKRAAEASGRAGGQPKGIGTPGGGEGSGKSSRQGSPEPRSGKAGVKAKEAAKSTPAKNSPSGKTKSSGAEPGSRSPESGTASLERTPPSRKLSPSMQSSAPPTAQPQ
ncbi:ubiquitin carboxyl-terminal hydrolase 31-like [Anguilla rostrata]|uniref:ubiquitin carboxyl-terminal hydrolase 31-like n=1 Tax=Anguilla rostrata TaxID=7938 RepID=UPI0030D596D6